MSSPIGVIRDASFFKNIKDIKVLTRTKAEAINRDKKEIEVTDLESGDKRIISYDKLVLATGSIANRPPICAAPPCWHIMNFRKLCEFTKIQLSDKIKHNKFRVVS